MSIAEVLRERWQLFFAQKVVFNGASYHTYYCYSMYGLDTYLGDTGKIVCT